MMNASIWCCFELNPVLFVLMCLHITSQVALAIFAYKALNDALVLVGTLPSKFFRSGCGVAFLGCFRDHPIFQNISPGHLAIVGVGRFCAVRPTWNRMPCPQWVPVVHACCLYQPLPK